MQGIYEFAGAAPDAMEFFRSQFQAAQFPLPVSWRCPRCVSLSGGFSRGLLLSSLRPEWEIHGRVSKCYSIKIFKIRVPKVI